MSHNYVIHWRWVAKHDLLSSSLKEVLRQVLLASTSEKSLFLMNIGSQKLQKSLLFKTDLTFGPADRMLPG